MAQFLESLGTKEPTSDAFNLTANINFFHHREKGRKKWKQEKQQELDLFSIGVCRIQLESLLIFNTNNMYM